MLHAALSWELAQLRSQELIAQADRRRLVTAAKRARREQRVTRCRAFAWIDCRGRRLATTARPTADLPSPRPERGPRIAQSGTRQSAPPAAEEWRAESASASVADWTSSETVANGRR